MQAEKKVSNRQVLEFRMETRAFLQALIKQLMLKSPLMYSLTKVSALDPRLMADAAKREANKPSFVVPLPNLMRLAHCRKVMQTKPKISMLTSQIT